MAFPASLDNFTPKVDNTDDVMAQDINELQAAIEALEAKVGIDTSLVVTSLDYKVNNFFDSGRKVWIYENSEPTGWSIHSASDVVLGVKGGSTYVTGGALAGTWTQPSHILTISEIPAHNHTYYYNYAVSAAPAGVGTSYTARSSTNTGNTGGGGAHNHGSAYRPYAAVGIIIEKL